MNKKDVRFLLIAGGGSITALLVLGAFLYQRGFFDRFGDGEKPEAGSVVDAGLGEENPVRGVGMDVVDGEFQFPFDESLAGLVEELRQAIYAGDHAKIEELLSGNPRLLYSSIEMCLEILETESRKKVPLTALGVLKRLWRENPLPDELLLNEVLKRLFVVLKENPLVPLRANLVKMLARKGYAPASEYIRELAFDRSQELNLQLAAISVLPLICGEDCVPRILALLRESGDSVVLQRALIKILAEFKGDQVVEFLLELAETESTRKGVLQEIIKTLGLMKTGEANAFLNSIASSDVHDQWLRAEAIRSLYLIGSSGSAEAAEHLTQIYQTDLDKNLRFEALHKVGRLGGELKDGELKTRLHSQMLTILQTNKGTRNPDLAARSLIYSGDVDHMDTVVDALRGNKKLDPSMLNKYVAHGKEGYVEKLQEMMKNEESPRMKSAFLDTLGRSRDPKAVDSILELMRSTEEDDLIKEKAAHALAWIKDPRVLPDLQIQALENEMTEARVAAVQAIGNIGGESALLILKELKEVEDISVSMAASGQYNRVKEQIYGPPKVRKSFRKWDPEDNE